MTDNQRILNSLADNEITEIATVIQNMLDNNSEKDIGEKLHNCYDFDKKDKKPSLYLDYKTEMIALTYGQSGRIEIPFNEGVVNFPAIRKLHIHNANQTQSEERLRDTLALKEKLSEYLTNSGLNIEQHKNRNMQNMIDMTYCQQIHNNISHIQERFSDYLDNVSKNVRRTISDISDNLLLKLLDNQVLATISDKMDDNLLHTKRLFEKYYKPLEKETNKLISNITFHNEKYKENADSISATFEKIAETYETVSKTVPLLCNKIIEEAKNAIADKQDVAQTTISMHKYLDKFLDKRSDYVFDFNDACKELKTEVDNAFIELGGTYAKTNGLLIDKDIVDKNIDDIIKE